MNKQTNSNNRIYYLIPYGFVILQGLLYGFGDPISKVAYETMPVYSLLTVRYFIATCFMMAIFGRQVMRELKRTNAGDWILPSLCIAGAYITGNIALEMTAATTVAFLRSLMTIITPILAFVAYRKSYNWKHLPILIAVMVGMYLLCGAGGLGRPGMGEVWALVSAALLAGSLVFGEKALNNTNPIFLTTMQCAISTAMALVCALIFERGIHLEAATLPIWGIIVYLAILCTVAGYFLQNAAMQRISSSSVALVQCSGPVMTAAFSRLILGEQLSGAGLIGVAIILICVISETTLQQEKN